MLLFKAVLNYNKFLTKGSCQHLGRKGLFKIQSFSSNSVRNARSKLQATKPKIESLQPQIEGIALETAALEGSNLWRPFLFTVGFSSVSLTAAAIWEFESIHRKRKVIKEWFHSSRQKYGSWRNEANKWWNQLSEGQKVFVPICLLNILVFSIWKVPAMQPMMVKYFCSNPAAKSVCWPMVFSTFSHYSTMHIFANMYVLHSFSSGCVANMGKEHFVGFYLTAGIIASFASYVHKVVVNRPGLSLGASGAIMGVLGYCCTRFPDLQLNIIFLPFFAFKASAAIKFIMGIDALGILLGWRFFDHAAHLGGALFGVFWSAYGTSYVWNKRGPVVEAWYKFRKATFSD